MEKQVTFIQHPWLMELFCGSFAKPQIAPKMGYEDIVNKISSVLLCFGS